MVRRVNEDGIRGNRCWRRRGVAAVLLLLAAPPAIAERTAIAVFRDWGAFREGTSKDAPPNHCFAIAAPPPGTAADGHRAFASVAGWPARRIRAQLSVRLSRGHQPGAKVTLSIGDAAFPLTTDGRNAWAHDRMADALIVRAMRSGSSMSISTIGPHGGPYADAYRLRGAATAIDAAMLACGIK